MVSKSEMSREILFRGKRTGNGEWVEGHLIVFPKTKRSKIMVWEWADLDFNAIEVVPETVGQYTGLTDKNGKQIFEGDIVRTHYKNTRKSDFVEQVVFHNGRFCAMYKITEHTRMWANLPDGVPRLSQDKTPYIEWCEVIGNIHDNPELLEVSHV